MIKGIGTDIVEIERFKKIKDRKDFLKQIFTKREILNIKKERQKNIFYAKHWGIKEAILKALRCGLYYGSYWHDIKITKKLKINPSGFIKKIAKEKSVSAIHISITHSKKYVATFVLVED